MSPSDRVRSGSVPLASDLGHLGSDSLTRGFSYAGMAMSAFSMVCMEASTSLFDTARPGLSAPVRHPAHCGSQLSVFSLGRFGLSSSTSDCLQPGSSPLRGFGRLGSVPFLFSSFRLDLTISAPDCTQLGLFMALQNAARVESSLSPFGIGRPSFPASAPDFLHLGLLPSIRSIG